MVNGEVWGDRSSGYQTLSAFGRTGTIDTTVQNACLPMLSNGTCFVSARFEFQHDLNSIGVVRKAVLPGESGENQTGQS